MITSFCVLAFSYSTTDTLTSGVKVFWDIYLLFKHRKIFLRSTNFVGILGEMSLFHGVYTQFM